MSARSFIAVFLTIMLSPLAGAQTNPAACNQCRDNCVEVHRIKCKADACTSAGGQSRPSACDGIGTKEQNDRYVKGLRTCEAREKRCQDVCFAGPCKSN